jgi:hypothetical protein
MDSVEECRHCPPYGFCKPRPVNTLLTWSNRFGMRQQRGERKESVCGWPKEEGTNVGSSRGRKHRLTVSAARPEEIEQPWNINAGG